MNSQLPDTKSVDEFEDAEDRIRQISRRSFLWAGAAAAGGFAGWRWLVTREADNGIPWPFRRALKTNEKLAEAYFDPARLAPIFERTLSTMPKVNGLEGMDSDLDPNSWSLALYGL